MAKSSAISRPRPCAVATRRPEVLERAELRHAPPCGRRRGRRWPRAARIAGARDQRVVRALARGAADRVDRAAGRRRRSPCAAISGSRSMHVVEGAVAARRPGPASAGTARTRRRSAPGPGPPPPSARGRGASDRAAPAPGPSTWPRPASSRTSSCAGSPRAPASRSSAAPSAGGVRRPWARSRARDQLGRPQRSRWPDRPDPPASAAAHLLHPRAEDVGPRLDRVAVAGVDGERERPGPARHCPRARAAPRASRRLAAAR